MYQKVEQIKNHFKDNKDKYLIGTAGVVAGAASVFVLSSPQRVKASQIAVGWNVTQNLQQTTILARRGHPGNIIRCNETGELFASQRRAAEVMGVSASRLVGHLKGEAPHVGGYTFENLGEAQAA